MIKNNLKETIFLLVVAITKARDNEPSYAQHTCALYIDSKACLVCVGWPHRQSNNDYCHT